MPELWRGTVRAVHACSLAVAWAIALAESGLRAEAHRRVLYSQGRAAIERGVELVLVNCISPGHTAVVYESVVLTDRPPLTFRSPAWVWRSD